MPTNFYQRSAMALAIAACFPALGQAAGVARVDFAVGNVTAQGPDGRTRPLSRGSEVQVGDTVNTQQGRAQLRFQDGAFMSLQPETAFKVEQFRFTENGGGNDSIVMNLLKGGMRTITGLIGRANRSNYKFRTEVATIGIRGTEYAVRYTNSIDVFCAGGTIEIVNDGGTLVLGTGQGGFVQSPNQEPQRSEERPFLPPTAASGNTEAENQIALPANPFPVDQAITGKRSPANWAISQRFNAISETDSSWDMGTGALVAFDSSEGVTSVGTSQAVSDGNKDGIIAWGRWVGGQSEGTFGNDLATEGAMHYIVGLPATNIPTTGVARYEMMGATTPSVSGTLTGATLNSSAIDVDFSGRTGAKFHMNMTLSGNTTTTIDTGAGVALSRSGAHLSGFACIGSSNLSLAGFLAGNGATRAGMAYNLGVFGGESGSANGVIGYRLGSTQP
jgi:hypothetical protein